MQGKAGALTAWLIYRAEIASFGKQNPGAAISRQWRTIPIESRSCPAGDLT